MANFPYTQNTGNLVEFLSKIGNGEIGKPDKPTIEWLGNVGYKSSNDRKIIGVLKFLGFIDASGSPTETWVDYRGPNRDKVLASALKEKYGVLFNDYPRAYKKEKGELEDYFRAKMPSNTNSIVQMATATFVTLCGLADFGGLHELPVETPEKDAGVEVSGKRLLNVGTGITININVQLTLPETTDESIYEKLFAAMKKHLLTGND